MNYYPDFKKIKNRFYKFVLMLLGLILLFCITTRNHLSSYDYTYSPMNVFYNNPRAFFYLCGIFVLILAINYLKIQSATPEEKKITINEKGFASPVTNQRLIPWSDITAINIGYQGTGSSNGLLGKALQPSLQISLKDNKNYLKDLSISRRSFLKIWLIFTGQTFFFNQSLFAYDVDPKVILAQCQDLLTNYPQ